MNRRLLWLSLAASVLLCLWAGHRYWAARESAGVSLRQLERVSDQAREISSLRSAAPPEARRRRPAPGLAARVADVVLKAGLSQSSMQSLSPETETGLGNSGLKRQAAKMTLDAITLPQLGKFLEEWRKDEPAWTVASIDIVPAQRGSKGPDRPLRAVIAIETVFSTDPPTPTPTPAHTPAHTPTTPTNTPTREGSR